MSEVLTQEEFERIDTVLARVLSESTEFDDFQVDFAINNADRLDRYGLDTRFSSGQWRVIRRIEAKIQEMEEDAE